MGVSVRQQKRDGKWFVHIRHAGQRAAQKCIDEQHAIDTAEDTRKAIRRGEFDIEAVKAARKPAITQEKSQFPTLAEFFDKTMDPLWRASLAPGTFDVYEGSFRCHVRSVLGDIAINEITRDQVKNLIVSLLKKNVARRKEDQGGKPEQKLSKDSIRNVVAVLRAMLNEAVERHLLAVNPATRLGKLYREAGTRREQVDPFTAEEIPVLLESILSHHGKDNQIVALTLFHTGMRASELAGLQWADLDFRERFITVRRQYKKGKTTRTKTKKIRKVDISDVLLQELQALKKRRKEEYLGRGKNEIPEWVFLSPGQIIWEEGKQIGHKEGQPLDMKNFRNRIFLKACDKAQIRRRRVHDTRHSFASILLMNGESPAYVRDQLGHASIKMTVDVYGHWIPGSNRQAVNRLPSLSTPKVAQAASGD